MMHRIATSGWYHVGLRELNTWTVGELVVALRHIDYLDEARNVSGDP